MQAVTRALFGNCGYVPDVASLQAWLECAWTAGFDPMGAEQLDRCASPHHQQRGRLLTEAWETLAMHKALKRV